MSMRRPLIAAGCAAALSAIVSQAYALQEPTQAMPAETVMAGSGSSKSDFPDFKSVTKDYTEVIHTKANLNIVKESVCLSLEALPSCLDVRLEDCL